MATTTGDQVRSCFSLDQRLTLALTALLATDSDQLGAADLLVGLPPPLDPLATNILSMAAGDGVVVFVNVDGTVGAWNDWDGFEATPSDLSNVVAVATQGYSDNRLAVTADGRVEAWNHEGILRADLPPGLSNVVAITAGYQHAVALRADGSVLAWGNNDAGQTDVPPGLINVTMVAAAGDRTLALRSDGTVVSWGDSGFSPNAPLDLTNAVAIACGLAHNIALRADGTVVTWGDYIMKLGVRFPADNVPPAVTNVVAVAAGRDSFALSRDGSLFEWGFSSDQPNEPLAGYTNLLVSGISDSGDTCVAVVGDSPPVVGQSLGPPSWDATDFSLSTLTQGGKVYQLQYTESLSDSQWRGLRLVAGNGRQTWFHDPAARGTSRFYRLRRW